LEKTYQNFFFKNSDALLSSGNFLDKFLISRGVLKNKIFFSPCTIDIDKFYSQSKKLKNKLKEIKEKYKIKNKFCILFIGQLINRKGIIELIYAYKKLKGNINDVCLIIRGDGPLKTKIQNIIRNEKIEDILLLDHLEERELIELYTISDIFILPSKNEVWGLVINEAMACGIPIITTKNVTSSYDLVESGINGYVLKNNSSEELYKAIKKLLDKPDNIIKFGKMSKNIIFNKYHFDNSVKGIYEAIISVTEE
jgi:glycosyltransferase involved in cell wall biosynthesis